MNKRILTSYARLIAKVGLNVQKNQVVFINCELDNPEFIAILVEQCYKLGAKKVVVDWSMQKITKLNFEYCSLETLSTVEKYELEKWNYKAEVLPAVCYIISENPDGLNGVDTDKFALSNANRSKIIKPIRDKMEAKYQWCIAAVPSLEWAKKVFPGDKPSIALKKLWNAILTASRVNGNAIKNWQEHNKTLKKRYEYLNSQNLTKLVYTSKNGTNLTVGLIDGGVFTGGAEKTINSVTFNPNIPSEEIFISPKAGECEGIVYATKPLSYDGQLIENFSITFTDGRVSSVKAEKNQELLEKIVKMDEGASMLGECAFVAYDSPINNTGILFYETLFDENACCHLALGRGFSESLKGFEKMSLEERRKKGINDSIIHVDFMIGTNDLKIEGIKSNGEKILIFNNGNWALSSMEKN